MADIFTKEKRSWVMSRIRSKNTKIDLAMKQMLSEVSENFTMYPQCKGNPDFVIERRGIAIFCDGDFWHGYTYRNGKQLRGYWKEKIERNMMRDRKVSRKLREDGWSVQRFWEHDIIKRPDFCKRKILRSIKSRQS